MRFIVSLSLLFLAATAGGAAAYAADTSDKKADQVAKGLSEQQRLQAAHERLEQAAREVAELSSKLATDGWADSLQVLSRNPNRAILGIGLGRARDDTNDGIAVASVSPGGPAANAGLKAGDVIVELNGKTLKRDKDDGPRVKLLNEMSKLSPGDEATVRYTREGKSLTTKVKVDRLAQDVARREFHIIRPGEPWQGDDHGMDFNIDLPRMYAGTSRGGAFGDLELVTLTPKLGQYFGAEKGLLIVHAPEKDTKLEDGDVLLDIDGRVPTSPGHAFRILGSYQSGEKVTLNVLRQRKKSAIAITVPESKIRIERLPLEHIPARTPRAPVAPVVPNPASAPAPVASPGSAT